LLLMTNLNDSPRARWLLTTNSWDVDRAGATPWLEKADSSNTANGYHFQGPISPLAPIEDRIPSEPPIPFPALPASLTPPPISVGSEFALLPPANPTQRVGAYNFYGTNPYTGVPQELPPVNGLMYVVPPAGNLNPSYGKPLGKVDLNRSLTPYPTYKYGSNPPTLPNYYDRYDGANTLAAAQQFLKAQAERQQLAQDIYDRLIKVTGAEVPLPPTGVDPNDQRLMVLRFLAQLAANIVDYIDDDDISTPFNFYPGQWVFGTELPRLVLNEVLAEAM